MENKKLISHHSRLTFMLKDWKAVKDVDEEVADDIVDLKYALNKALNIIRKLHNRV